MNADWIDPLLPKMRCDAGCGLCCGAAPTIQSEFDSVAAYAKTHGITPRRQGVACPFYQDGTCAVYAARPTVCRWFGHTEHMQCPKGYNVNVTPKMDRFIALTWHAKGKRQPERILHELAYTIPELVAMAETIVGPPGQEAIPDNLNYHFCMTLSELGHWKRPMMYMDTVSGEVIVRGDQVGPKENSLVRKVGEA